MLGFAATATATSTTIVANTVHTAALHQFSGASQRTTAAASSYSHPSVIESLSIVNLQHLRRHPSSLLSEVAAISLLLKWTESDINLPPSDVKRMNPSSSSAADINPQKKTYAGLSPSPEVLQYVASCVAPSPHLPTVSSMTISSIIESMIPSLNSVDEGGLADTKSPCGKQKDCQSSPLELPAPLPVQRLEQTESRDSSKTQTDPPRTEQPDLEDVSSEGTVSDHPVSEHES